MKLPFDFGIKLLFRLLLPGLVLTLGLAPFIFFILDWVNWPESHLYVLVITVIVAGWLVLVLDMQIYMFFEGRRFWRPWMKKYFLSCETRRLEKLQKSAALSVLENIERREEELKAETDLVKLSELQQKIQVDRGTYLEALFDIKNFAMDDHGEYQAKFPTRLGNLIESYEDYSKRVYGMDSVFYWSRLWLKLDKDLREEIDGRQAVADSTVYVAFVCFINALIWIVYAAAVTINGVILSVAQKPILTVKYTLFQHLPPWWSSWLIALAFLFAGLSLYRLSLRLHAQFGEVFKSVFDVFHDQINVSRVMGEIADYANDYSFLTLPLKERLEVTRRYLRFGLIRCSHSGCGKRIPAAEMKDHLKTHLQP
jgi:hypothetical protein